MSKRFRTWSKIYREKMNIKREGNVTLAKRRKWREGEGDEARIMHGTCNNLICMKNTQCT